MGFFSFENGVFTHRHSLAVGMIEYVDRYIVVQGDVDFDYEIYVIKENVAQATGYTFQTFDVNNKSAVVVEFNGDEADRKLPRALLQSMARHVVNGKRVGVDINSFRWLDRPAVMSIIVGTFLEPQFEASY